LIPHIFLVYFRPLNGVESLLRYMPNSQVLDFLTGRNRNILPFSPIIIGEKLLEKWSVVKSFKEFHNLNPLWSVSLLLPSQCVGALCKILNFPPKCISVLYQLPLIFSYGVSHHSPEPPHKNTVLWCQGCPRPLRQCRGHQRLLTKAGNSKFYRVWRPKKSHRIFTSVNNSIVVNSCE